VDAALAMYAAIRQHPATVHAYIESQAASAASFVAMAADKRIIAKNAKIVIHDAHGFALGANAKDMRTLADMLDEESNNIAAIYAERAGGEPEDWRRAMQANDGIGTSYRGQEAVEAGLADEVAAYRELGVAALVEEDLATAIKSAVRQKPEPALESLLKRYPLKEALEAGKPGGT
jgi:ATP-dependent protease ClpP protease subunit